MADKKFIKKIQESGGFSYDKEEEEPEEKDEEEESFLSRLFTSGTPAERFAKRAGKKK